MTFKAPPTLLNKKTFAAGYAILLDYFGRSQDDATVAFVFSALKDQDPYLTCGQWEFIVKRSMTSFTFFPKLNDLLGLIYRRDLSGMPELPDIDPKYADSYQQGIYERAKQAQDKWLTATPPKPMIGNYGLMSLGNSNPDGHIDYAGDHIPDVDCFAWLCPCSEDAPMWRAELMLGKFTRKEWEEIDGGLELYPEEFCLPPADITAHFVEKLSTLSKYYLADFNDYYQQFPQLNPNGLALLPPSNTATAA